MSQKRKSFITKTCERGVKLWIETKSSHCIFVFESLCRLSNLVVAKWLRVGLDCICEARVSNCSICRSDGKILAEGIWKCTHRRTVGKGICRVRVLARVYALAIYLTLQSVRQTSHQAGGFCTVDQGRSTRHWCRSCWRLHHYHTLRQRAEGMRRPLTIFSPHQRPFAEDRRYRCRWCTRVTHTRHHDRHVW